jgi:hypothetical protein
MIAIERNWLNITDRVREVNFWNWEIWEVPRSNLPTKKKTQAVFSLSKSFIFKLNMEAGSGIEPLWTALQALPAPIKSRTWKKTTILASRTVFFAFWHAKILP